MSLSMQGVRAATAMTVTGLLLLAAGLGAATAAPPNPGETQLVSVSTTGAVGDADSSDASISADGRFVVFSSKATNLGWPSGGVKQIYLRDLTTGATTLMSGNGSAIGNANSTSPSISDDGGVIAYISAATNIVAAATTGIPQVFVWTRATGATTIETLNGALVTANAAIEEVALSGDGRSLAFATRANNLTGEDTRAVSQIFERDLVTRTTVLVSHDGSIPRIGSPSNARDPSISGDGSFIAFSSTSALSPYPSNGYPQIFRWQRSGFQTDLVSINKAGTAPGRFSSESPSISRDGNVVAFASNALDLTDEPSDLSGIYLRDIRERVTRLASANVTDGKNGDGNSWSPSISADGSSIAFVSDAGDLTREAHGVEPLTQVYKRDLASGVTSLISRPSVAAGAGNVDSPSTATISGDGELVAFTSSATNLVPGVEANSQIYLRETTEAPAVVRVGGADRYAVSAGVSAATFSAHVPVVYVASGATFPDALSGSAAAGAQHAPVLLVATDSIPDPVAAELRRLLPQKIIVLGGPSAIDPSVEVALAAFAPTVTRIGGADRFDVSVGVSSSVFGLSGVEAEVAYVASGTTFPDALSGSAAAGYTGGPVLLVTKDTVPILVAAELGQLRPHAIVVLGGTSAVSDSVVTTLSRIAPTSRIAGADRFVVSAAVSAATFPAGMRTVYVASGTVFPDALSGSAAAIRRVSPVLLVTVDSIPDAIKAELTRLKPTRIVVLGGTVAVSDAVLRELGKYAVPPS